MLLAIAGYVCAVFYQSKSGVVVFALMEFYRKIENWLTDLQWQQAHYSNWRKSVFLQEYGVIPEMIDEIELPLGEPVTVLKIR